MRSSQFLGQNVREGLADALEWRLLGLLVERPHGEWKEQVAALARETTNPLLLSAADAARQASEGL
jgi:hypothetical protein